MPPHRRRRLRREQPIVRALEASLESFFVPCAPSPTYEWVLASIRLHMALEAAIRVIEDLIIPVRGPSAPHMHSVTWWRDVLPRFSPEGFREFFRVPYSIFMQLVERLSPILGIEGGPGRPAADPALKVAVALRRLSVPETCVSGGTIFGINPTCYPAWSRKVWRAIVTTFGSSAFRWPATDSERASVAEGFPDIPHIIGAIDCSHIPLAAAPAREDDQAAYYSYLKRYSIKLLAVVDSAGMFRFIESGWPGSVHDSAILRASALMRHAEQMIPSPWRLIGDSGFPLLTWLLVPFRAPSAERADRQNYNRILSSMRVIVENAFGRLKARFRRLKSMDLLDIVDASNAVAAACVLHNMCTAAADPQFEDGDADENPGEGHAVSEEREGSRPSLATIRRDAVVDSLY